MPTGPMQDLDPDAAQTQSSSSKSSWFAKLGKAKVPLVQKSVREGYHDRSSEIAKRYAADKMV